jgi:hypothetical protein
MDKYKLYPKCTRYCATKTYTCLSILRCAKIQREQMPIVKALYGDNFGEFYDTPMWKARSLQIEV